MDKKARIVNLLGLTSHRIVQGNDIAAALLAAYDAAGEYGGWDAYVDINYILFRRTGGLIKYCKAFSLKEQEELVDELIAEMSR